MARLAGEMVGHEAMLVAAGPAFQFALKESWSLSKTRCF